MTIFFSPFGPVITPEARVVGMLKEKAVGPPMNGSPSRLNSERSIAWASVTVPSVERGLAPSRSWSTRMAVVSPSIASTSGRGRLGMNPWMKVE